MTISRFFPNTRETADETKRRVWRDHGMLVVDVKAAPLSWEARAYLEQIGAKLYGPRRQIKESADV